MSHQSLYRAYRPHTFADVAGQESVVEALNSQIASGKVSHAYLFAGSRGLGKTSIARIFARELGTDERDLYEIDAASNNSVDDIRALTENIYTLPFNSKYKIYILDEAHMLSKGAWNAFLKTLEEPPAHALFILATTELEKVPDTVQSRCQVFTFKKPSRAGLATVVARVSEAEGYAIEPAAADLVSLLADGSYRDALSVLERVMASNADKTITRASVEQATGAPRYAAVHELPHALSEGSVERALAAVRQASDTGIDLSLYLSMVLEHMRAVLLVRFAPELRAAIKQEQGEEAYAEIERLAQAKPSKLTHQSLKVFLDASQRMKFSPVPALPLELAVLEVLGHD